MVKADVASKNERRNTRSTDPQEALRLQLVSVCEAARLDAVVLASADGLAIAHVGDADLCSEIAALVPFVAERSAMLPHSSLGAGALHVRPLHFEGQSLYLATCDSDSVLDRTRDVELWLARATEGVTRILAAA